MNYYSLDSWLVHPGCESEFIASWTDLLQWTMQEVAGKVSGVPLYRDLHQSHHFFCPMAWESLEALAAWRSSQGYQNRIERIEHLCADLEARTLVQVTRLSPRAAP
jgi:quinol monooxygenase YgiN